MFVMERITKIQLARNLDRAIGAKVGIRGLNTLLCGWKKNRRFGKKYCHALNAREWLYITEVMDLSDYAGYDLAKKSP